MTLQELFSYVESVDFAASIGIQSGLKAVKSTLETDKSLSDFIGVLRSSVEVSEKTYNRLINLLQSNDNPQYRHPHDIALTGYFYILSHVNDTFTKLAVEAINQTSNLWWAKRLAIDWLESRKSSSNETLVFTINEDKFRIYTEAKQTSSDYQIDISKNKQMSFFAFFDSANLTETRKGKYERQSLVSEFKERIG